MSFYTFACLCCLISLIASVIILITIFYLIGKSMDNERDSEREVVIKYVPVLDRRNDD